jgi:2-polyprenyl-3-methyl-5-hydroxy-6-metoxy-1,4-benzoquinol methylase
LSALGHMGHEAAPGSHAKSHFGETKQIFKKTFQTIWKTGKRRDDLLEAAFFAYGHMNPLIDLIFWRRLKIAEHYVLSRCARTVLDFGTGSGVMPYCLAQSGISVVGADTNLQPLEEIRQYVTFPPTVAFVTPTQLADAKFDSAFELILALDVLEHIEDLADFVQLSKRVLKPSGVILVSGPTENIFYRFGRLLAGRQFTGHYHVSRIADIRARLSKDFNIVPVETIYPVLPLFEIFAAKERDLLIES